MTTELQTNNQQPAVVQWLANPSTLAQLRTALPSHFSAERMARLALTAFRTNRGLQNCTPSSIMAAVMSAAQLGLEPHVQGQCYLVPHGNECTLIVGYQGLLDLIRRSGANRSPASSKLAPLAARSLNWRMFSMNFGEVMVSMRLPVMVTRRSRSSWDFTMSCSRVSSSSLF